jgi:hypothetical protein
LDVFLSVDDHIVNVELTAPKKRRRETGAALLNFHYKLLTAERAFCMEAHGTPLKIA